MCGSLFLSAGKLFYPQQRVKPFRRSGGLPPQARLALLGRGLFAMTWRGECRRLAAETRGDRKPYGVLSPFALVGGHRHPRPPKAAIVHAHFERKSRFQRRAAVSAEGLPSADGKEEGAHRLRRAEVSRQLKKRLYSGRGLWYADNKCLQDFVGTDDRSAGLHHILSHYVEKRQMNVRSVFAALYTA